MTQSAWKDGNYIANYSRFGMLLNGEGSPVQGEVCSMLTIHTPVSYTHLDVYKRQARW